MKRRRILFISMLSLAALLIQTDAADEASPDARLRDAENNVRDMKVLLAGTTNEEEVAVYRRRVDLAEERLIKVKRLAELREEEESFTTERRTSPAYVLLEALAAIDTTTNAPLQEVQTKNKEIRRLKQLRTDLLDRLDPMDMTRVDNEKVHNLNAELQARTLERDIAELRLRLAREAERVDRDYRSLELNPRPTVRMLHQKHQNITHVRQVANEIALIREGLESQQKAAVTALDLAQKQAKILEDEIATLRTQRDTLRRDEKDLKDQLNKQLNYAISEKDILTSRLIHIPTQAAALEMSLFLTESATALTEAEEAFLTEDYDKLRHRFARRITLPFAVCLAIAVVYTLLSRLIFPIVFAKDNLFVARRLGSYNVVIIIIIVLISFFLEDLKAIATVMGIVGAAVVIALQDLCSSFAGWFVIVSSRKLKVGDRVEIDGHRGDIIDIQILRTTMMELNNWLGVDEPTGRIVIVPNSFIFKSKVFNYSHVHPYIWGDIPITVTFETPAQEAYDVLLRALTDETTEEFEGAERGGHHMIEEYGLVRTSYEPHIHSVIADSGVTFTLFYVTHYRRYSTTRDKIVARILKEFEANPLIEFAYPTERHIRNLS